MPRSRRFWSAIVLGAAVGLLGWQRTSPPPPAAPPRPDPPIAARVPDAVPAKAANATAPADHDARREALTRLAYAQAWDGAQPDTLAAFRDWTRRYLAAPVAERAALTAAGVALARTRRPAMRELIIRDPATALALTVPAVVRRELPAAVVAELERRHAGVGDLDWQAALYAGAAPPAGAETLRHVVALGGETFRARVYGRRLGQPTREGASLHGIALDGEFAVHESPLRVLEPGEIPARAAAAVCPVTAQPAATVPPGFPVNVLTLDYVEAEGRLWGCCAHDAVLAEFEQRLLAAEEAPGSAVRPAGPGAAEPARAAEAATARTLGQKRLLVIRADFSDFPGTPMDAATLDGLLNGQVRQFFEDCSYGQASLTATVTAKVYRLPDTAASYATANNSSGLHNAARSAVAEDHRTADFDLIMVVFRSLGTSAIPGSQFTWGGLASVGGSSSWINGSFSFGTLAHELGHNFGLKHASLWTVTDNNPVSRGGTSREYADPFDVMGNNPSRDGRAHFNHRAKNQVGWLPDSAVIPVKESGTYRIFRHDNPASARDRPLALRVFRDGVRWYWIGFRQNYPDNASLVNGANILWAFDGLQETQLLDCTTPAASANDSALAVGATLSDPDFGIRLRPLARGGADGEEWLDVEVVIPAAPPDVVATWGSGQDFRSTPTAVTNVTPGLAEVAALAVGTSHALALRHDGTIAAWGDNQFGQNTLPSVTDLVASVAAGGNVSGLITRSGAVQVWGSNINGQLNLPEGLAGVRQLAFGVSHALALRADGTVAAWGNNSNGQTSVPASLADVVAVAAGDRLSVALRRDGTVVRWGVNFTGVAFPSGLAGIAAISASGGHVLALTRTGTVVAWGSNASGQCNVPAGLDQVVAVAAGGSHSLALRSDGTVVGWGSNTSNRSTTPPGLPRARAIAAGSTGSFAIVGPALFVTAAPQAATVALGGTAIFEVRVASAVTPPTYQWRKDGVALTGATGSTLTLTGVAASAAGTYDVVITAGSQSVTAAAARLTVSVPVAPGAEVTRIANLSIRTRAGTGAQTLIVGFVVGGAGTGGAKPLLVRGVGPALGAFGVADTLADPRIELFNAAGARLFENDNWLAVDGPVFASVGAFPFTAASRDAALSPGTLASGGYSAQVSGVGGATGVVLAEIYDVTPGATFGSGIPRLVNVSARTVSGTGADTLIAGFTVAGPGTKRVLIRAVGPTLGAFGVTDLLADPRLELFDAKSVRLQENDNWGTPASGTAVLEAAFRAVGAFVLPANSRDAAVVATLAAGGYTAQVSGVGGGTGVALVEIYEVP